MNFSFRPPRPRETTPAPAPEPTQTARSAESSAADTLGAAVAVETWRLGRRVARLRASLGEDASRPVADSLQRLEDLLQEHDIVIRVHDGERYNDGMSVEVIHIREQADPLFVVETVSPTVLHCGRIVRNAQVVLGARTLGDVTE